MAYSKLNLKNGQKLTATHLAHIESGIAANEAELTKKAAKSDIPDVSNLQPKGDYALKSELPSTSGFATEEFVVNKIAEAELADKDVDLSGYYTKSEVDTKIAGIEHPTVDLDAYVTEAYVNDVIAEFNTELSNKASKSDIPDVSNFITEHQPMKTLNGESLVGNGNISISAGGGAEKKKLNILFIGNSLSQDAVSYVPLLLDEIVPEVDYNFYSWYNGGATLAQQYQRFTNNTPCQVYGTIQNNSESGWNVQNDKITMKWICENCDFDAVVIQEYSYYSFDDNTEITNFNNIINYLRNNYNKAFKVFTFIDAPMRNRVASDYEKAKKYAKLHIVNSVAEGLVNPGTAVVHGLENSLLKTLGDRGNLSGDGTHTQEGLPCMLQSYVIALWMFEQLGIPKSILNSNVKMTRELYANWQSLGPNLGSGVVEGTAAQVREAQAVAVKAYKVGKQMLNSFISAIADSGDPGSSDPEPEPEPEDPSVPDSGETEPDTPTLFKSGAIINLDLTVGDNPDYVSNNYTTEHNIYKVVTSADATYDLNARYALYEPELKTLIAGVVCDENDVIIGIIPSGNRAGWRNEEHTIDMTAYENAKYLLFVSDDTYTFAVEKGGNPDTPVVPEGPVGFAITEHKAKALIDGGCEVGAEPVLITTQHTGTYSVMKVVGCEQVPYALTVKNHGLYNESNELHMPLAMICDANDIIVEIIRCAENVSGKVRTETVTVDMTNYDNTHYVLFTALPAQGYIFEAE